MNRNSNPASAFALVFLLSMASFIWPPPPLATALNGQPTVLTEFSSALTLSPAVQLCGIIKCGPLPAPVITQVNPASQFTPGGAVVVWGSNFDAADGSSGQFVLTLRSVMGAKRGVSTEYPLGDLQWGHTAAYGVIPANIGGVLDQTAELQIVRSDGTRSNKASVQFTAARSVVELPGSDVQVQCSQAADQNHCNAWTDYSYSAAQDWSCGAWQALAPGYDGTTCGLHVVFLRSASGVDTYSFNLKNGWAIDHVSEWPWQTTLQTVPAPGTSQGTFNNRWQATAPGYNDSYSDFVFIIGPQGVPWK